MLKRIGKMDKNKKMIIGILTTVIFREWSMNRLKLQKA